MSFFTYQEIVQISKRIGCDVFIKQRRLSGEDYFVIDEPKCKRQTYLDDPDFEIVVIKARLENEKDDK